jgi:hypothetical protein
MTVGRQNRLGCQSRMNLIMGVARGRENTACCKVATTVAEFVDELRDYVGDVTLHEPLPCMATIHSTAPTRIVITAPQPQPYFFAYALMQTGEYLPPVPSRSL